MIVVAERPRAGPVFSRPHQLRDLPHVSQIVQRPFVQSSGLEIGGRRRAGYSMVSAVHRISKDINVRTSGAGPWRSELLHNPST
jgi:hypothetical protein